MTIRLVALTMLLAVAGCGSTITGQPTAHIVIPDTAASAAPSPPVNPVALPVSVDITSISVHTTQLQPVGLNKDGTIETPSTKTPQVMGYYIYGGRPCEPGPTKIPFGLVGHIDGSWKLGVLAKLKDLKSGDTVTVGLDNGKRCTYRIDRLAEVNKHSFPTGEIWGPVTVGSIRIISCGGPYVGAPDYYRDNLVGIGVLVS